MAFYTDSEQLYDCMRILFTRIGKEEPGAADSILASRLVIRMRCTEPSAEFTLNGRQRPVQTTFGPSPLRATLDIGLAADTLHRILLGELSLKTALANGLLTVRGPVLKAMALADLFHRGQAIYPEVLSGQGLASRDSAGLD
jgi:hypothetical protein